MADCTDGAVKAIIADCTTQGVGGNEIKAWYGNRKELSFVYDATNPSKVTGITASTGKQLFPITVNVKALDSGADRVVATGLADRFTHFVSFSNFEFDTASVENIDNLKDLVFIVESKDKKDNGDGVFRGYGFKHGLTPLTDSNRANDANGARNLEFGPTEGDSEPWSQYTVLDTDYETTKALLISLETPAP